MSTFILKCKMLDFLPDMKINHISFNLEMHLKFTLVVLVSLERKDKRKENTNKNKKSHRRGGKKTPNEIWDLSFDITYYTVCCYAVPVFREEAIRLD